MSDPTYAYPLETWYALVETDPISAFDRLVRTLHLQPSTADIILADHNNDHTKACQYLIETYKEALQLKAGVLPHQPLPTKREQTPVSHKSEQQMSCLSSAFIWSGTIVYAIGGILALAYSLYIAIALGFDTILAFVLFPIFYILLPFYTLFTFGDPTLLILNYGVGIVGFVLTYIGNYLNENKNSIFKWLVIGFVTLFACGFFVNMFTPYPSPIIAPTLKPTRPPTPTIQPATPTPACLLWSQVTPAMAGQTICVYGVVVEHRENWENLITNIYFGTREQFYLVSNYHWNDKQVGECVTAEGKVQLNTYKIPYIKIEDRIDYCP